MSKEGLNPKNPGKPVGFSVNALLSYHRIQKFRAIPKGNSQSDAKVLSPV